MENGTVNNDELCCSIDDREIVLDISPALDLELKHV